MDKVMFGAIWLLFVTIFFLICIFAGGVPVGVYAFLSIFVIVGLLVLLSGIKKISKDAKTNKNGEICYGVITGIETDQSAVQVNGRCQSKAVVQFYVNSLGTLVTLSENIGFKENEYQIGSCVIVKYYDNDINIVEKNLDINTLPYDIQDNLKSIQVNASVPTGMYTGDENTIIINGVKYTKSDDDKVQ